MRLSMKTMWCSPNAGHGGLEWRELRWWRFRFFHNRRSGIIRLWYRGDENWRDEWWMRTMTQGWPYAATGIPWNGPERIGSDREIDGVFWTAAFRFGKFAWQMMRATSK